MMIQIFAVYDLKASAYLPPFTLPTAQMAARTFGDCVNDPQHAFGRHPHDYTLFHLGEFDDTTGKIHENKRTLGNGLEHVAVQYDEDGQEILPGLALREVNNKIPGEDCDEG